MAGRGKNKILMTLEEGGGEGGGVRLLYWDGDPVNKVRLKK